MIRFRQRAGSPRRRRRCWVLPAGIGLVGGLSMAMRAPAIPGAEEVRKPPVTYARDVAPIVERYCRDCHRPGGAAPFSLLSYADASGRAERIQDLVQSREMPPWPAAEGAERYRNARRLTEGELETIAAWVQAEAPEGEALPPARLPAGGWMIGRPDQVLEADGAEPAPPAGQDTVRDYALPFRSERDRWVSAIEVQPVDPAVVQRVFLFTNPTGRSLSRHPLEAGRNSAVIGTGARSLPETCLADWAPGTAPYRLPSGVAFKIPAHSSLVMRVRYRAVAPSPEHHHGEHGSPAGAPSIRPPRIGLHYSQGVVERRARFGRIEKLHFQIPARVLKYALTAAARLPRDINVLAVIPSLRLLGSEIRASATTPDGQGVSLISIPVWDPRWRLTYTFNSPQHLPRGTQLRLDAAYNNTPRNHFNPHYPPELVSAGPRPTDEECACAFLYTVEAEHLNQGKRVDRDGIEGGITQLSIQQAGRISLADGERRTPPSRPFLLHPLPDPAAEQPATALDREAEMSQVHRKGGRGLPTSHVVRRGFSAASSNSRRRDHK